MAVLTPKYDSYGEIKGYTLTPTACMRYAASMRALPENHFLSDTAFCKKIGIAPGSLGKWRDKYNLDKNYFDEWWEEKLELDVTHKNIGKVLESIGIERALQGEAAFWLPLAKTAGVVSPERLNIQQVTIPLNLKNVTMTEDEFNKARERLMAECYGLADTGGIAVDTASPQGQEGAANGAGEVQAEPVEIPVNVGSESR